MESVDDPVVGKKRNKWQIFWMKLKRRLLSRHLWIVRGGFVAALVLFLYLLWLGIFYLAKSSGVDQYVRMGVSFVFKPDGVLREIDGRTNLLILGKSGEGYIAPDLTDTMILMSVGKDRGSGVSMVSLPRDIWIADMKTKLNSVYYWGNKKQEGGGLVLTKSTVEDITGVPVHYAVVIDFDGFVELIDLVGGVDVRIEKSFADERFPIAGKEDELCGGDTEYGCRYETVVFEQGVENMNGERALKYVRSRHSEDLSEGTDFARSRRQQEVIEALRKKMMSRDILSSPKLVVAIWNKANEFVETDMDNQEMAIIARRLYDSRDNIKSHVIPEDLLYNPPIQTKYDNLYVFIPNKDSGDGNEDWSDVRKWAGEALLQ